MTRINVILTKNTVYTTFNETIHACIKYFRDDEDKHNDGASVECRALAFSLSCTSVNVVCSYVDWTDKKECTDADIFDYLNSNKVPTR